MSTEITAAQTANIDAARAFLASLGDHLQQGLQARVTTARATLTGRRIDAVTVATLDRIRTQITSMAATCEAGVEHLDAYHGGVEQAVNATPEAADTDFYRAGAHGAAPHSNGDPVSRQDTSTQDRISTVAGYYRCRSCRYVVSNQRQAPTRCPRCQSVGGEFDPAEITFPDRPTDEAIARDTRDVEAAIRDAYARLAFHHGDSVSLADLRDALPAGLDRDTVDAALYKLAAHSDVHIVPRTDQHQADERTQQAALNTGTAFDHAIRIERGTYLADTLQRIRSTSQVQAESMLAPLSDADVAYLAERMDVDTNGTPEQLRERVAERAGRNQQEWRADARQGQQDGTLLYRADNEPDWVATWDDEQRREAQAAAARLQHRAATQDRWAYVKARADRWAAPSTEQGSAAHDDHPAPPARVDHVPDVEVTVAKPAVPEPGLSEDEIRPPNGGWGIDQGLMHFDGALGKLWNALGDDQHLQVDGRALGNVVTDLGEGITLHKHDTNHALAELRRIRTQLPDTSSAARSVDTAINRLDAPDRPAPALPDHAPQQLKTLMADLNAIPLVRRGYDHGYAGEPFHETDQLANLAQQWLDGKLSPLRLERGLQDLTSHRHESMEGWTEIRTAVARALSDVRQWAKRPR